MAEAQNNGPYVGRSIPRREDRRLLMGRGQFVADLKFSDTLHAVFVRSQVAHARIRSVDLSRALAAPGVVFAISGAELVMLLPPCAGSGACPPGEAACSNSWSCGPCT